MLTTRRLASYQLGALLLLIAGCAPRPVLHEFPPALALHSRPAAVVNYTLRSEPEQPQRWELLGGQGATMGSFTWERAFREASGDGAAIDRSEDLRRNDRIRDELNGNDYIFRISATSGRIGNSSRAGTAPPRLLVLDAATGERLGDLELRTGFGHRVEGTWRGRSVLWQIEFVSGGEVERDTGEGTVADRYPTGQLMQWTGGFDAGLKVYVGKQVDRQGDQEPRDFGQPVFDITADRPLTRLELGDTVILLLGVRSLQEFAGLTNM